jgi:hypothetical protein
MRIKNLLFLMVLTCIVFLAMFGFSSGPAPSVTKMKSPKYNAIGFAAPLNKHVQPPEISREQ